MKEAILQTVSNIRNETALRWNRVGRFKPRLKFSFEQGTYIVKTAETVDELKQSFKLRNEVFNKEFRGLDKLLDVDRFDAHFDHLLIVDTKTSEIVGTYRLKLHEVVKNSYTELEFDLGFLDSIQGPYLELGRACIQKTHRKGSVMSMLWRGIAEYMKLSQAQVLFGCSSVKVDNPRDAALVYQDLVMNDYLDNSSMSRPQKNFLMDDLEAWIQYFKGTYNDQHKLEAEQLVPSLLKSYLRMGAKIVCEPAYDKDFECIDFLTLMRSEDLDDALAKKLRIR